MTSETWNPLSTAPPFPAVRYASIADRIAKVLGTRNDVLLIQAEAVVALEAVATSLARPGLKVLNIVTSPYGLWFGNWLRRGGADVIELAAEPARPIDVEAVERALNAHPDMKVLALCHAESASCILNPMEDILALARARGIVTIVDAVASVGGHDLNVDELGVDIAIIGPQKSLAGPAGLSALSVSSAAWQLISREGGPTGSILSLLDQKIWLDAGRGTLPGTTAPLEFFALEAALDRLEAEGLASVIARHGRAARATHAGLIALGAEPWVKPEKGSHLVTAVELSEAADPKALLAAAAPLGMEFSIGVGPGANRLIRLNHTGLRARFDIVLGNVTAYGIGLRRLGFKADIAAAVEAIALHYGD
ncbi:pyridoxal-phosphate-dependent aminotransferase family protein [Neorhizobium petrolearium]|uniref:Aminotransferase class V-fold PLP-dependent enzyme n=1 Tax=Neorhizobium petrolearium TaxID=515361 RepID=A0ABY8M866_9HYPH|nr:aminotransferase class V-fold PLP-dependent enzyme [Neorhizobium petrolearium]MCC2610502.1 aminotransferase class V-fold PLP-dependent enzyme [Neorhizobium petrolearium]WGI70642.1 aminotransferase class V-fold PLP-dependent enzyme [Neorhizobium petrolearium]